MKNKQTKPFVYFNNELIEAVNSSFRTKETLQLLASIYPPPQIIAPFWYRKENNHPWVIFTDWYKVCAFYWTLFLLMSQSHQLGPLQDSHEEDLVQNLQRQTHQLRNQNQQHLKIHQNQNQVMIIYYKMFSEMRTPWLVRTSSLYFHKACVLVVTWVHYGDIIHTAYVISTTKRNSQCIL